MAKRLVELHGGTVSARSILGLGSEFVVRLPSTLLSSSQLEAAIAGPAQSRDRLRILVVDDSLDMAESTAMIVRAAGHEVRTAYDGPSALEMVGGYRPHAILLDIGLPGMNGHEVAKRIRLEPALQGVILVAVTGYGQDRDRQTSLDAGFDHHLVKPTDFKEVRAILTAISAKRV